MFFSTYSIDYFFLRLAVGALLAIFSFLTSKATAVGAGNVLFLFGRSSSPYRRRPF